MRISYVKKNNNLNNLSSGRPLHFSTFIRLVTEYPLEGSNKKKNQLFKKANKFPRVPLTRLNVSQTLGGC